MKDVFRVIGIIILISIIVIGLSFVFGYGNVLYTKTVGKSKQNAEREVFNETQSYVQGKIQEANKYYLEYLKCNTEDEKEAIRTVVRNSFATFDENKLSSKLRNFVNECKYGTVFKINNNE